MLAKLSPVPIVKILPAVFQLFESRPVRLLSAAGFFYALEPGTVMNQFGEVLRIAGALLVLACAIHFAVRHWRQPD